MFAVIACSQCRTAWSVELRHATVTCPHCRTAVELLHRTRLWAGDSAADAQAAVAAIKLAQAGPQADAAVRALRTERVPRHDSHTDAAAAHAGGIINKSQRAEAVAVALSRLAGTHPHAELLLALEKSGIEPERAEVEVGRMLAMDLLMEPKAGHYRAIGP